MWYFIIQTKFKFCNLNLNTNYWFVFTISSIFNILRTVSEASVIALVETKSGWITFSSKILVIEPFLTLIPVVCSPLACRFRSSVTVAIGFNPAFSASVDGIIYNISKYIFKKCVKNLHVFLELNYKNIIYNLPQMRLQKH